MSQVAGMTKAIKPLILLLAILSLSACESLAEPEFCNEESKKVGAVYASPSAATLKIGDSVYVVGLSHNPEGYEGWCTPYPSWTSSDTAVATVRVSRFLFDEDVYVRGHREGKANIIAKAGNIADTIFVTVVK